MTPNLEPVRIALVHYTGSPAIGGVETYIAAQIRVLRSAGYHTRLIVGNATSAADQRVIPWMHPTNIAGFAQELGGRWPPAHHAVVQSVLHDLLSALDGCDQVWVHNVLTLTLNPFLAQALIVAMNQRPRMRWIVWIEDLSCESAFVSDSHGTWRAHLAVPRQAEIVTISTTRREEIARAMNRNLDVIQVIPPAVDVLQTMSVDSEAEEVFRLLDLGRADLVVLVPAKLLPHKRLDRVIQLAQVLREHSERPMLVVTGAPSPHEPASSRRLADELNRCARACGVAENISFLTALLGRAVSDAAVRSLMFLADFLFVPSDEEGFCIPIQEAALIRLPVIASDIPVHHEHAPGALFLFEPDRAGALQSAVQRLMADPAFLARRRALASWQRFSSSTLDLAVNY